MAMQITATQGGSTANGMVLRVIVLTGAAAAASQTGANVNTQFSNTSTWTQSITTSAGSNVYGAAAPAASNQTLTAVATTIIDNISDPTNGESYVTFKALNVTAGATVRGFTESPGLNSGPFAMLEILASGTLAEDASSPAAASTTSATTVTTASFTPPNGSLLVAMVGSDGGVGVTTMTVSGGGLTWTEKVKNNPSGGDYAGIWIADGPAGATVAGTVQPQSTFPLQRRKLSRVLWHGGTGFNRPAGTTQPPPTLTPPRRKLARVLWAGSKPFLGFTPGTTQPRPTIPIPRRTPARAVVQFKPVTTTNAALAHVAGTQQPQTTLTWPRRRLSRAVIQFTPVRTTNAVITAPNGTLQPRATVLIPRRTPARAFIRFTPLIAVNAIPPPALSPLGAGGSIEGELWRMYRDGDWPKRPPGFGPVGQVPTVSTRPEEHSGRGWVGKKVRRFFWPRDDD